MSTTDWSNLTTTFEPGDQGKPPIYVGFIAAGVSVIFFGSNFVPVKKFETGDGMYFQWVLCVAIWFVGLVVELIRRTSTFYMLPMLGGFIWCTGNTSTVLIIKTIGLAQGFLLWATTNLVMGWASGRFGWFGLIAQVPHDVVLNYIGMALCCSSAVFYLLLKPVSQSRVQSGDAEPLINGIQENWVNESEQVALSATDTTFIERMSPLTKRVVGITAATCAGAFYGVNFVPVIYMQDHPDQFTPTPSSNGLDYVFSHFTGILFASTIYFVVYCAAMRNKPRIYSEATLPAIASGVMWGIAQTAFFIANDALQESVTFPIISTGPPMIGAIFGVFVFREIKGLRNYYILGVAFACTISGAIMTGFSK